MITRTLPALVAVTLVVAACGTSAPGPSASPSPSRSSSSGPFLLVDEEPRGGWLKARIEGKLYVSPANCVMVGDTLLSAPFGSTVWADGRGVTLSGVGDYQFGEKIALSGGVLEKSDDPQTFESRPVSDCDVSAIWYGVGPAGSG